MSSAEKNPRQNNSAPIEEVPVRRRMAVLDNGTSLRQTIMREACEDYNLEGGDSELTHDYYPQEGKIVIHLPDVKDE